jgi:20S proteasome alpha/beta subunit
MVQERVRTYNLANLRELNNSGITNIIEYAKTQPLPFLYNEIRFLEDCANLTKEIADKGRLIISNPIESIVATHVGNPMLFYIDSNGIKIEVPNIAIGSGSEKIGDYLKNNYSEKMTLDEAIFLGTFLIKYNELLGFDKHVGVGEKNLPQIFILNKKFCGDYKIEESKKKEILSKINSKIKKIKKELIVFPTYFKQKKEYPLIGQGLNKKV